MLQSVGVAPGTGKTHVAIALGVAACHTGQRVLFATATDWVARLQDAHQRGRLAAELTKLRRYGLIIIDEVGCAPRGAVESRGRRCPPPVLAGIG